MGNDVSDLTHYHMFNEVSDLTHYHMYNDGSDPTHYHMYTQSEIYRRGNVENGWKSLIMVDYAWKCQ